MKYLLVTLLPLWHPCQYYCILMFIVDNISLLFSAEGSILILLLQPTLERLEKYQKYTFEKFSLISSLSLKFLTN